MLRGNYPATMDPKGRLKIPSAFKSFVDEHYGNEFYVTSVDGQSARAYPLSVWSALEEKLIKLPSMNKAKKKLLDRTSYWGQTVQMDGQGRILIPALVRESAELRGEVAVIGQLNFIEVWDQERFRENLERNPVTDEDLQTLSDLGI